MKFHIDYEQPSKHEVFVFGSNLAGVHGAGAAKQALIYGAKWEQGVGAAGRTYAIPTKDFDIKTMSIDHIRPYVELFKKLTLQAPHVQFFVTRVGCGLAGYKDSDIAPLFKGAGDNCNFPESWRKFLIGKG